MVGKKGYLKRKTRNAWV